jgi:4-diphosphocytidyl-2-C-methyl-D-erythritol kinase
MLRGLAPGKVNLSLFLGGLRGDGRHELVTLFQPVSLADEVLLIPIEGGGEDVVVCPGVEGVNLAERALAELRSRGWDGPPVRIEISKGIPVAGGMAGGSADAAATLRLASASSGGPLSDGVLAEVARVLGADVPSQLTPGPALGTGAGEVIEPVPSRGAHAFLILPSVSAQLSTPDVFAEADRLGLPRPEAELRERQGALEAALRAGPEIPIELLVNDLEPAARSLCPSIDAALECALELGAEVALVCGSGPTVAGIFWGDDAPARALFAAAASSERFPEATAAVPVDANFASIRDVGRQPRPAQ